MPEQRVDYPPAPPQPVHIVVEKEKEHSPWLRRTAIVAAIGGGMYLAAGGCDAFFTGGNGSARVTAGVNHATEQWQRINFDCEDQVSEIVGVNGIQHNHLIAGMTSGGLKVNKGLEGDFMLCGDNKQGSADLHITKKGGKVSAIDIRFHASDFVISQPRVDMLSPVNRAPLRADDSVTKMDKKIAECKTKDNDTNSKNNCYDTGISIDWPKIYQGGLFFGHGPDVSIPGPHIAINPDEKVRLASLMYEAGQLAIALDGTTIQRWNNAITAIEQKVEDQYIHEYEGLGVGVSMDPAILPSEPEVIKQRLDRIAPDIKGLFTKAQFVPGPQGVVKLHVEAPGNTKMDVVMSDVQATPQTLADLNMDLANYGIGQ
ncbi:MAG TPA: hypothetical protein VFI84_01840 [Candidatus Saccharimonadales bacterium]|nr:hypothetical protein [Candidatus Saccharimonadales bacterium]